MKRFGRLFLLTILISSVCFSQNLNTEEIPFSCDKNIFPSVKIKSKDKITSENESVETRFPSDLPAHKCYELEDKKEFPAFEKGARYFSPAYSFICFIPTTDKTEQNFAKSYPNFSEAILKLNKLLKTKKQDFGYDDLTDIPFNNSGSSFKSKIQFIDYEKISGVFFLTQYTQEMFPNLANNEELTANFQGLTKDGKFYVAARFSVTHPSLPKGIDFTEEKLQEKALSALTDEEINKEVQTYLEAEKQKINNLPGNSFNPSLNSLKNLIASISIK